MFPGLMGLPPELLLCLVGASYKAVAKSAAESLVGRLVMRGLMDMDLLWSLCGWDGIQYVVQ